MRPDDLDDFAALCSDPEVIHYMADGEPLPRDQTMRWIEVSLANYEERGWGCFAVAGKQEDAMIGFAGFARPPDRPGIVELIYAFLPEYWGRGYATEVAAALVDFAFDRGGLTRLEATVDAGNEPSKRILEKIGFSYVRREFEDDEYIVDYYEIESERRVRETA